jgi:hypothetical protein
VEGFALDILSGGLCARDHRRWPPGLRDELAGYAQELGIHGPLYAEEKTDEEIAEEEVKGR